MANPVSIEWQPQSIQHVKAQMDEYQRRVLAVLVSIADFYAPQIEATGKSEATWIDRTGNARQGLRAWRDVDGSGKVFIYFAHSVQYGIHLEQGRAGRYAIIMPTLEKYYSPISNTLRGVFKK